jgi:hypothetical protein
MVTAWRRQPLSSGSVRYLRWPLLLGPAFRVPLAAASKLDLHAGAAVAWLHLSGSGFADSSDRDAVVGGGFVSTRFSLASKGFEPFAELSCALFPATRAFVVRGPEQIAVDLPHVELYVALGASLRVW